jgi:hypothetical protein
MARAGHILTHILYHRILKWSSMQKILRTPLEAILVPWSYALSFEYFASSPCLISTFDFAGLPHSTYPLLSFGKCLVITV